jgi:uncharacterized protein (TIGR03437 family)
VFSRPNQSSLAVVAAIDPQAKPHSAIVIASAGDSQVTDTVVVNPGPAPALSAPRRQIGKVGSPLQFAVSAIDSADLPVQLGAHGIPRGAAFDTGTGTFRWIPEASQAGRHVMTLTAENSAGQSTSVSMVLDVDSGRPILDAQALSCSPGAIHGLRGRWLAAEGAALSDTTGGSASLGGTRVVVNGISVPVLFASETEVRFLCPELKPQTPLAVQVESPLGTTDLLAGTMLEATPAIATPDGLPQDEAVMSRKGRVPAQPAQPGDEIVIRATGLGWSEVPAGTVLLEMSGIIAPVASVTAVPGEAGMYAVRALVPPGVAPGDAVPLQLQVVTPDGRRFESNRTTLAVEAVRP